MALNELKREFRGKYPSSAVASYDYTDIAEGTGVVTFDGFVTKDSTGNSYKISSQTLYSSQIEEDQSYSVTGNNFGSYTKVIDKDFDLTSFNFTKTIRGVGFCRFSGYVHNTGGINNEVRLYFIVRIRKWDGTTETEVASVQSETITTEGAEPEDKSFTFILPISISETQYKRNEILRVTIEGWVSGEGNPGTSTGNLIFGTDPRNRNGTYIQPTTDSTGNLTTNLKVWIPFKIDI